MGSARRPWITEVGLLKRMSDWYANWARRAVLSWRSDEPTLGWWFFFGRSRLERRIVRSTLATLAVLQLGLAGFAELVPVRRLVHEGDTYTIHRGHSFFLNVFPLLGPVFVLGGHHRLTIQSKSGATRVEIVDLLEDLARDYPFLFVQQGPEYLLK